MKYLKVAGVAWGLIYFVMGAIFSFTLGSNDFGSGVALFLSTYFLSLPIAILAVWFPRIAHTALLICLQLVLCAGRSLRSTDALARSPNAARRRDCPKTCGSGLGAHVSW
ncbi:MAG: hypothetical protein P4L87_15500 [Formivibrio sp.]|nr:hypothetical protein [Formivibrio sp.]